MTNSTDQEREEELVRALLAPLARAEPVVLRRSRAQRRKRPALVAAGVSVSLALAGGGMAAAGAFGPLHGAVFTPPVPAVPLEGQTACQLIGETAAQAASTLTKNGYRVGWRFMHWGTQLVPARVSTTVGTATSTTVAGTSSTTAPTGPTPAGAVVGGYESAPTTVPGDSVVWQVLNDSGHPGTVLVFVQEPHDPDAPTIERPGCSKTAGSG
jgi:hypothetical protein